MALIDIKGLSKVCLVGGVYQPEEKILKQGDIVSFYPWSMEVNS